MRMERDFLVMVALAAAASTPVMGQNVAPGLASASTTGVQSAASIPNLSGIWGRDWFTFEPPSSGPGPLVSKLRNPDGTLIHSAVGDYSNPILSPQAAELVKKKGEIELSGAAFPSPHNQCWPEPTPYTLSIQLGLLVIQQKDEVILISLHDQQSRHGAGGSSPLTNEYGRGDIDPDTTKPGLQVEITVDDPATFTTAWSGVVTYRHVLGEWPEAVCAENTRGSGSSWIVLVPQAEKPDF
jgi:hypothetical protein